MSTQQLGVQMMRQMRCPENVDEEVYIRHLAIFVSFILSGMTNNNKYSQSHCRESLQGYLRMIRVQLTKYLDSG